MAPYPSHKKRVKFAKSRSPVPHKNNASSATSYANIVLHYLSKLKGLFRSVRSHDEGRGICSNLSRGNDDGVSKSILKKYPRRADYSDSECESKDKAYDIVAAALQYGCANNIIEKVGNYFLVKTKSDRRIATRRPTPGPDYIRCASCKNLAKYSKRRSITNLRSDDKISSNSYSSSYCDGDFRRGNPSCRKRNESYTSVTNYCPKCYSRLKSNRKLYI